MTRRCHEHANQECVVAYSRLSRAINRRAMAVTPRTSPTFDKISSKCRSNARRDRTPDHMQVLWSPAAKSDSKVLQEQPDADLTSSISAISTTAVSAASPPLYAWSSSAPRNADAPVSTTSMAIHTHGHVVSWPKAVRTTFHHQDLS